jgi:hypothetical protein
VTGELKVLIGLIILDYSVILISLGVVITLFLTWLNKKAGTLGISGDELLDRYFLLVKTRIQRKRQPRDQYPRKRQ